MSVLRISSAKGSSFTTELIGIYSHSVPGDITVTENRIFIRLPHLSDKELLPTSAIQRCQSSIKGRSVKLSFSLYLFDDRTVLLMVILVVP